MDRSRSQAADEFLGLELRVHDHGFVQLIDYMGIDTDITQAARTSYGPSARPLHDERGLLRYLMRHRHTSPFEMCEIKLRCRVPIFIARQWIRHRTANVNEMSLRYSEAGDEFYAPDPALVASQSTANKQGRGEEMPADLAADVQSLIRESNLSAFSEYRTLIDLGTARELARVVLPLGTYTEWVWKIDLHNLLHFLALRLHPHAQAEMRAYAEQIARIVKAWVPMTWEAFEDYRLHAVTFSRQELAAARAIFGAASASEVADAAKVQGLEGRELQEFLSKIWGA